MSTFSIDPKWLAMLLAVAVMSCSGGTDSSFSPGLARKLAEDLGETPLDYSDPAKWACTADRKDDVCDVNYTDTRIEADGSTTHQPAAPDPSAPIDCFYIYPTVDWSFTTGNHDDLSEVRLPELTVQTQAGRFSEVCRVFAPYYRQATIASYALTNAEGERIFRKAFMDVATAFEYYLDHWNNGRPMVLMGHSQGAQMTSYLLHLYFDGADNKLRTKLLLALPIGFNVFTPTGQFVGGSFSDIPLCTSSDQTGCVIHYRSFPEGYEFPRRTAIGGSIDELLGSMGYLYRSYSAGDVVSCVNPSSESAGPTDVVMDGNGKTQPSNDARILEGTFLMGLFTSPGASPTAVQSAQHLPGRYTATCRKEPDGDAYLAIGLRERSGTIDVRGDPLSTSQSLGSLGLHLYDFNLALGDLIMQVRVRSAAFSR
ncbi:MAG: DUF3089 domain-containing protein [Nitrospirae bacterium]|nr:DUF3089 domain-containing protein [Nitrospirota bacterium]